ncbi:tetratricopeptide repeat protein [Corallococcus exercitus]|uniref:Tetratricopeptide repeat protein n=1 Tax=Corallococcus exercitus TaxID=2316736 RepID=A0A7Y4KIJ7_9BACT|nr:zf-HC2 domain-containing protein [Corallococcus exercitus]NOK33599.1 tetratricopeptide repeat protein [Corallococcus exercitus]
MNAHCTRLHLFMDGELSESDAEGFRNHLPRCAACEGGLRDLLQLELLAARALGTGVVEQPAAKPEGNVVALGEWVRRNARVVAPLAMAASLCAIFVPRMMPAAEVPAVVFLDNQTTRELEARLSDPRADKHRPYSPMRGGADGAEAGKVTLPLRPLAEMEERKDFRGIVAAYVLHGQWQQAQAVLAREPASHKRNIDLSVVALQDGRYQDALKQLESVLLEDPGNPQALWNRGLALRALGQKEDAAAAFDKVAEGKEPGWSDEARDLAKGLREEARKLKDPHDEAAH